MSNTSATGGYLLPSNSSIEGVTLRRFLGAALVALTGLPAEMVRPTWQANPPPMPSISTNWLAFGINSRGADFDPYVQTKSDGLSSTMQRTETLELGLIFYGPDCMDIAAQLRDTIQIRQNTDALRTQGVSFFSMSDIAHVPELVDDIYFDRADATLIVVREIRRDYNVLSLLGAGAHIKANRAVETLEVHANT